MSPAAPRPTRPPPEEYAPFYAGYVDAVGDQDPFELLETQFGEVERLLAEVERDEELAPYAPGKWSVKEVLVHLSDAERIFSTRILRLARGDATPLPGYEQDGYATASRADERSLANILAELYAVRASTLALLWSLDEEAFTRRGTASDAPTSVRALLWIIPGHMKHHIGVLRDKYGLG